MSEADEKGQQRSLWKRVERFADGESAKEDPPHGAPASSVRPDPVNAWLAERTREEKSPAGRMSAWLHAQIRLIYRKSYHLCAAAVCLVLMVTLLLTVSYLPEFGNPDNPANNEVSERYLEEGLSETGAVNLVSGMILDYRAFDTLGESHVLFLAAVCVIILLRKDEDGREKARPDRKRKKRTEKRKDARVRTSGGDRRGSALSRPQEGTDAVLRLAARILVPCLFLFGIYVILNGHLSAGGGFSGGAVLGGGLILCRNAFPEETKRFFKYGTFKGVSAAALLCYALLKAYSFYTGANHLESGIPLGTPGAILSAGLILPLNICVGLVVACTMYAFYSLFSEGGI